MWKRLVPLLCVTLMVLSCSHKTAPDKPMVILLADDIATLEPNKEFEALTDSVLFNIYEPLVCFDKDLHIQPALAESWENPTPEEWRFHLRQHVKFHDGSELTPALVQQALLQVQKDTTLEISGFLGPIREIRSLDQNTISIRTEKPYAILTKLPFVYITKKNSKDAFPPISGTGPYRLSDWKQRQHVRLECFPDYWGPKPQICKVEYRPVPDSRKRFNQLLNGAADMIYSLPPELTKAPNSKLRFARRPGITVFYLAFNLRNKPGNPFSDIRVRKAIHLALDRKGLVQEVLFGFGAVPSQFVAPYVFGYSPDIPFPARNLEEAQKLMQESGFANGFKTRLDFNISRQPAAEKIQNDLRLLNIDVQLNGLQGNSVYDLAQAGMTEFYLAGWDCSSGDASEFYEFCLHTNTDKWGAGNYSGYSNAEIDLIAETNSMITDERERKEMLQKASHLAMSDLPLVPVYIEDDIYGMRSGIRFEPRADAEIRLLEVQYEKD